VTVKHWPPAACQRLEWQVPAGWYSMVPGRQSNAAVANPLDTRAGEAEAEVRGLVDVGGK
jgi:hypothetical protein